jgi:hypothetical protein
MRLHKGSSKSISVVDFSIWNGSLLKKALLIVEGYAMISLVANRW